MSRQHYSLYDPRNKLQEDSIKFLCEDGRQLGLNLGTGQGKTFCVAYSSTKLNVKTLIITPNESLKQQWISTYHKMFDYRPKELMNITGSNIIDAIMETVTQAVANGDKVTIVGFGSFAPVKRAARIGINPAKGTKMEIPARTVPKFTASKVFKDMVNN